MDVVDVDEVLLNDVDDVEVDSGDVEELLGAEVEVLEDDGGAEDVELEEVQVGKVELEELREMVRGADVRVEVLVVPQLPLASCW